MPRGTRFDWTCVRALAPTAALVLALSPPGDGVEAPADRAPVESRPEKPAPLGTAENPVKCDYPEGEGWYLSRLRNLDGTDPTFRRRGSGGVNPADGHILDIYESDDGRTVMMDMYHRRYIERDAPPGFRILCDFSDLFEFKGGKVHRWDDAKPYSGAIEEKTARGRTTLRVKDGVIQGELRSFHPSGSILRTVQYNADNRFHGTETFHREDGTPWAVYRYAGGLLHGKFVVYHPNGKPSVEGSAEDGAHHGPFKTYHESGATQKIFTMENGLMEGTYTEFDPEGKVIKKQQVADGRVVDP